MVYINLNQLDISEKESRFSKFLKVLKEIFLFLLVNISVFVIGMIVINFNTYKMYLHQYLPYKKKQKSNVLILHEKIREIPYNKKKQKIVFKKERKRQIAKFERYYQKLLEKQLKHVRYIKKLSLYNKYLPRYLKIKQKNYQFVFNILPPGKRILIPSIGVDAPIIDLKFISSEKFVKGDFDEYLYKGVVKYPYTPNPGHTGNILIFGHTSYYWWKKNPYGDVFAKIPLLKHGDIIEIIRDGKVYKYKIFKKFVKLPYQVKYVYEYYNKCGKILTIMGCYPIGTDRKRLLIVAKQINNIGTDKLTFRN